MLPAAFHLFLLLVHGVDGGLYDHPPAVDVAVPVLLLLTPSIGGAVALNPLAVDPLTGGGDSKHPDLPFPSLPSDDGGGGSL